MTLRAHHNVIPIAEERERRRAADLADDHAVRFEMCVPPGCFVDWRPELSLPSHPSAQALLAGLLQGIGEREKDGAMVGAGRRLAEAATRALPGPPRPWWRRWLGLRVPRVG
jgi:hypothetical protein